MNITTIPHNCKRQIRTTADRHQSAAQYLCAVSRVGDWAMASLFEDEQQLEGALRLAHQQYKDGLGKSVRHWLGMSEPEVDRWLETGELPQRWLAKLRTRQRRHARCVQQHQGAAA